MSLTAVLSQLNGLFSRSFWFGSFLPLAVFAAANISLASVVFPGSVTWSQWGAEGFTNLTLSLIALVVASYAVSPLVALFRSILDGTLLPEWVHDWFRRERSLEMRKLRAARVEAKRRHVESQSVAERALELLPRARAIGVRRGRAHVRPSFQSVLQRIEALENSSTLAIEPVTQAVVALARELKSTNADLVPPLEAAHEGLIEIIDGFRIDAEHDWLTIISRGRGLAADRPEATRVGDVRAMVESYAFQMYGVDFHYIWPRLPLVIVKDSPLVDRIQSAQGQVDFAALTLILSAVYPVIWAPLLAIYVAPLWPLLVLGATAPLVMLFLYELLVESELAFGDTAKVVIDKHRLDLLTTVLRQPMPTTLGAERELWRALCRATEQGTNQDLNYRHPASGAAS